MELHPLSADFLRFSTAWSKLRTPQNAPIWLHVWSRFQTGSPIGQFQQSFSNWKIHMVDSWNRGYPQIIHFNRFSIINHLFTPIYGNPRMKWVSANVARQSDHQLRRYPLRRNQLVYHHVPPPQMRTELGAHPPSWDRHLRARNMCTSTLSSASSSADSTAESLSMALLTAARQGDVRVLEAAEKGWIVAWKTILEPNSLWVWAKETQVPVSSEPLPYSEETQKANPVYSSVPGPLQNATSWQASRKDFPTPERNLCSQRFRGNTWRALQLFAPKEIGWCHIERTSFEGSLVPCFGLVCSCEHLAIRPCGSYDLSWSAAVNIEQLSNPSSIPRDLGRQNIMNGNPHVWQHSMAKNLFKNWIGWIGSCYMLVKSWSLFVKSS